MEAVKAFNAELCSLYDLKPPVSKAKMNQITKTAMKAIKFYKHVVQSVEKFIQKCRPEYKVPGLYVVDSIIRQSRRQFGPEKDVFATRFSKNIVITFTNLFACPSEDLAKIIRVLNLWQKNGVYSASIVQPLLDLSSDPHSQTVFEKVQKNIESVTGLAPTMPLTRCDQKPPALTADALQLGTSLDTKPNSHTDIIKVVAQMLQPAPSSQPVLSPQAIQLQLLQQLLMQQMQMIQEPAPQPVIDSSMLSQLQDLTQQLLGSASGEKLDPAPSDQDGDQPEQRFNKKLLEFDYGDSEEEGERRTACDQSTWHERAENSAEIPVTQSNAVSQNPDVRAASRGRTGRCSDELVTAFRCGDDWKEPVAKDNGDAVAEEEEEEHAWKGNDDSRHSEQRLELAHQTDSDDQLSETKDEDEKSKSSYVQSQDDGRRPEYDGSDDSGDNNHSMNGQQAFRKDRTKPDTQKRYISDEDCIIVESDSSDDCASQRQKKRLRLSRNRSASRSRSRSPSCSRSRSTSRERRRKSKNKDRKSNSETTEQLLEKEKAKKERDRKSRGLPPMKDNHISICSTTVWIGHLNKQTTEDDLQEELCKYGEATVNLIPPRGCAFVCFNTRKEASKALEMLKGIKLLGNALKVAWAPGVGIKESTFRKLCNIELGVTYIPWEKAPDNLDLLLDGGVLDEDSIPQDFAVRSEVKEVVEEMELSRDSTGGAQENEVHQQSEITSSENKTTANPSSNSIPELIPLPLVPPPIAPHLLMSTPVMQPLGLSPLQSMPVPPIAPFSQPFTLQPSNLDVSLTRESSLLPEFARVSGMSVAPALPPADGTSSSTSSDEKALATEVKVHYETADWSEPWKLEDRSDATNQQHGTQTPSTAAAGQISNAIFSMAPVQNSSGRPLPAFSHHQAVCSVAPPVAAKEGTSDAGLHQPLGSFSGGLPAFDPTKPPPGLFGVQNKMQNMSDMTSVAKDDVLGNWSNRLKHDQTKNENGQKNTEDAPSQEARNDERWNQGAGTPRNLNVARRSDMRAFPHFSDRGGGPFEANSMSAASTQVSQSEGEQIFSSGCNDLKQLPSPATFRGFGNGSVPQDEMRWMSQNNSSDQNFPIPALSSFAHVLTSSCAVSLNKSALQFSRQGLPFNNGGAVHSSFAKQEMSVDRGQTCPANSPSNDLRFPSSVQSPFGSGRPCFPGAGQVIRSGLERPSPPSGRFPSPTTQAFANEQRLPYNVGPRLSGLDDGTRHQSPLGKGSFSPDIRTEPSGVGQRISDIQQQFPYFAQVRDSTGRMPDPVNMDGPGRMSGPVNMSDPGRMSGPVNIGDMGCPRNMSVPGHMSGPVRIGGPGNMEGPGHMAGPVNMGGPGHLPGSANIGNMGGPRNMGVLGHMAGPANMGGPGNMDGSCRMPGPINMGGSSNVDGPGRMSGQVNMGGPGNIDGPGHMPGTVNMGGPGNMDGSWHMSNPVNMGGPRNMDGPGGSMSGPVNLGGPGNVGGPVCMPGSGIMGGSRDLHGQANVSGPGNMPGRGTMPDTQNPGGPGGGNMSQWSSPRLQDHPGGWSPRDHALPNPFMKMQPSNQHPNQLQSPRVFASKFESAGDQQKFQPTASSMGPRFGEPHFGPGQPITTNESRRFMHSSIDQRLPSVFQQNDVKAFVPRLETPRFPEVLGHLPSAPWLNQGQSIIQNCPLNPGTSFNPNRNEARPQLLQTVPTDPQFFRPRMIPNSPNVPDSPIAPSANTGAHPEFSNMSFMRKLSNEISFPYTANHNRPEERQNQFEQDTTRIQWRQNDSMPLSGSFRNVEKREHYSASNLSNSFNADVGKNDVNWKLQNTDHVLPM